MSAKMSEGADEEVGAHHVTCAKIGCKVTSPMRSITDGDANLWFAPRSWAEFDLGPKQEFLCPAHTREFREWVRG